MPAGSLKTKTKYMPNYKPHVLDDNSNIISVYDMDRGDIGIIIQWGGLQCYLDIIVQRSFDDLIMIGNSDGWRNWFKTTIEGAESHRVKLLEPGTTIKL